MSTRDTPTQPLMIVWTLWGAFMAMVMMYLGLTFIIPPQEDVQPLPLEDPLVLVFVAISFILAVAVLGSKMFLGKMIPNYFTFFIIRLALAETIGTFGLLLFILQAPAMISYALFGASELLLLLSFPARDDQEYFARPLAERKQD